MKILICGGAGYIGSHVARYVKLAGHDVVIVDNLVTGHHESVVGLPFYLGDIGDSGSERSGAFCHEDDQTTTRNTNSAWG